MQSLLDGVNIADPCSSSLSNNIVQFQLNLGKIEAKSLENVVVN